MMHKKELEIEKATLTSLDLMRISNQNEIESLQSALKDEKKNYRVCPLASEKCDIEMLSLQHSFSFTQKYLSERDDYFAEKLRDERRKHKVRVLACYVGLLVKSVIFIL